MSNQDLCNFVDTGLYELQGGREILAVTDAGLQILDLLPQVINLKAPAQD